LTGYASFRTGTTVGYEKETTQHSDVIITQEFVKFWDYKI